MTKEEMRALEGEKDVDSLEEVEKKKDTAGSEKEQMASTKCTVDITSLRRSYDRLFALDNSIFESGLVSFFVAIFHVVQSLFSGECFGDALFKP